MGSSSECSPEQQARDFLETLFKAAPKASDFAIFIVAVSPCEDDPEDADIDMAQYVTERLSSEAVKDLMNGLYNVLLVERGETDDATATRH